MGKKSGRITKTCRTCQQEFQVVPSRSSAMYCSAKCMYGGTEPGESEIRTCKGEGCEKKFKVQASTIAAGRGMYCSRKCSDKARQNPMAKKVVKKPKVEPVEEDNYVSPHGWWFDAYQESKPTSSSSIGVRNIPTKKTYAMVAEY